MPPHVEPLQCILLGWLPSLPKALPRPHCTLLHRPPYSNYPSQCCSTWEWPTPEVPCVQWAPIQTVRLLLKTSLAPTPLWVPCLPQRCPCSSRWVQYKAGLAKSLRSAGLMPWFTPATSSAFSCMTVTTMTCRTRWAPTNLKKYFYSILISFEKLLSLFVLCIVKWLGIELYSGREVGVWIQWPC